MRARTAQRLTKIEKRLEQLECRHLFCSPKKRSCYNQPLYMGQITVFEETCDDCGKVIRRLSEKGYYQQKLDRAQNVGYVYVSS